MANDQMSISRSIVVADDSHDSRQILARLLRQYADAEVTETRNGTDTWAEYQRIRPRITFLDIDMPGLSGLEVLAQIRTSDPKAFVVMVSGTSAAAQVREAITLGAGGFVVKPYAAQRIVDVLRKYAADTEDHGVLRG